VTYVCLKKRRPISSKTMRLNQWRTNNLLWILLYDGLIFLIPLKLILIGIIYPSSGLPSITSNLSKVFDLLDDESGAPKVYLRIIAIYILLINIFTFINLTVPSTLSFIWNLFLIKLNYIWSLSSTPTSKNVGVNLIYF